MKRRGHPGVVGVSGATPGQPTANITMSRQIAVAAALVRVSAFPEGYSPGMYVRKSSHDVYETTGHRAASRRGQESTDSTPAIRSIPWNGVENTSELVPE